MNSEFLLSLPILVFLGILFITAAGINFYKVFINPKFPHYFPLYFSLKDPVYTFIAGVIWILVALAIFVPIIIEISK